MEKKTVAVLFGGQSSEHEVSCVSAITVINHINRDYYNVVLIGITKEGKWLFTQNVEAIESGKWRESERNAIISPDRTHKGILILEGNKVTSQTIDVVFPVLHGLYGEDGTVQGLLELAGIPYIGCGVLSSAVSMDKLYTKIIVDRLKIKQAAYLEVNTRQLVHIDEVIDQVENKLPYPVFIKPSNAGSSKGVTKAHSREELIHGLRSAAEHDRKILVEETIIGREIECAILGGLEARASGVGEIIAAAEFYDYDAKYNNEASKTVISPDLPEGKAQEISEKAVQIYHAVDGFSLSRVDFFLEEGTNEVIFNEINTLPGFTGISMYPMLWEAKGIAKPQLVEKLIQSAFTRDMK